MAAAQQWLVRTWDTVLAAYAADVDRVGTRTEDPDPSAPDGRSHR
jgi:hypothetical protein